MKSRKSHTVWIKLEEEERAKWYQDDKGEWQHSPLPSVNRMHAKSRRQRFYVGGYWSRKQHPGLSDGWHVENKTREQMAEDGYREVPRNFNGEVIIRADIDNSHHVQVQLPAEYGPFVVVRMYGATLAKCSVEGMIVDGDRIRGPFRLLELGGVMTLTIAS